MNCCEYMKQQLEWCDKHGNACPERAVRQYKPGVFGIPLPDNSYIQIKLCPWCGTELQNFLDDHYEEVELNAGNVKFAQDIKQSLIQFASHVIDEMDYIKRGRRDPIKTVEDARLDGEKIIVKLRRPRAVNNLPDDEWEESFPASYLNDKNWVEQFKIDYVNDKV